MSDAETEDTADAQNTDQRSRVRGEPPEYEHRSMEPLGSEDEARVDGGPYAKFDGYGTTGRWAFASMLAGLFAVVLGTIATIALVATVVAALYIGMKVLLDAGREKYAERDEFDVDEPEEPTN